MIPLKVLTTPWQTIEVQGMAELAALIIGAFGSAGSAVAAVGTSQAAQIAAIAAATAAAAKGAGAGAGTTGAGLAPTAKATEAELSRYKQEQRNLLRKRRASLATTMKLEEPKLGKQSLLGV